MEQRAYVINQLELMGYSVIEDENGIFSIALLTTDNRIIRHYVTSQQLMYGNDMVTVIVRTMNDIIKTHF